MKAVTVKLDDKGLDSILKRVRMGQELGFDQFDLAIENPQAPLGRIVKALKEVNAKLCAVRLSEPRQKATVFRRPGYSKLGALSREISVASGKMVLDTTEQLAPARPGHLVLSGGYLEFPTLIERQLLLEEHLDCDSSTQACPVLPKDLMQTPGAKPEAQLENFCRELHGLCSKLQGVTVCLMPPASPFGLLTPQHLEWVFDSLKARNLGYWHSTSSAAMLEKLSVVRQEEWLTRFGSRLKGVYLADNLGAHGEQAPGLGDIDFKKIAPELARATVRVLVTDDASGTKMRFGSDYLVKVGIF